MPSCPAAPDGSQGEGGIPGIRRERDDFTIYLRRNSNARPSAADIRAEWENAAPNSSNEDAAEVANAIRPSMSFVSDGYQVLTRSSGGSGPLSSLLATAGSAPNAPMTQTNVPIYVNGTAHASQGDELDRSQIGAWCPNDEQITRAPEISEAFERGTRRQQRRGNSRPTRTS